MAQTPPYKNSNESWVDDPNHLFSEDFEESGVANSPNGHWYGEHYDDAVGNGGLDARTKGWGGTIFANPITPAGAAENGVGVGGSWAGHHGTTVGPGETDDNGADHNLSSASGEFHVRWYQKWTTGYIYGAEKILTFNKGAAGSGGIWWGNIHMNCGLGTPATTATSLQWQPAGVTGGECQNVGDVVTGEWMCIEVHFKKSTTRSSGDGRIRVWMDACGSDGLSPPGSQTLGLDYNNINLGRADGDGGADGDTVLSLWWEIYANPGSTGTSLIDNIVVLNGNNQIGFVGEVGGSGGTKRGSVGGL